MVSVLYRDNGGGIATLLTKVMRWNGSYDAKVDVSKLEMINENNTTYFEINRFKRCQSILLYKTAVGITHNY